MGYFDKLENVEGYIRMADGYDGRELIEVLKKHLKHGATLLELGMGPGVDLNILARDYDVTGSDSSDIFLNQYKEKYPDADLLKLDAAKLETDRKFDSIYSNKVLHHLTTSDLKASFVRQRELLNSGGLSMHSFWYGDREEEMDGLHFVYYTEEKLLDLISPGYEIVLVERYKEMEDGDSFYILLRKEEF